MRRCKTVTKDVEVDGIIYLYKAEVELTWTQIDEDPDVSVDIEYVEDCDENNEIVRLDVKNLSEKLRESIEEDAMESAIAKAPEPCDFYNEDGEDR